MNKLFLFLESINTTKKFNRVMIFIFNPIFLLLEYLVYRYYWKTLILPELITNDDIFSFLDKNEFGFEKGRITKKDLFDDNEFYETLNMDEAKVKLKEEFVGTISDLLSKKTMFDIEEYLTLIVTTEYVITKNQGETYQNKVYTVYLQFCRYYYLMQRLRNFTSWIVLVLLLSISVYFGLKFIP